MKKKFLIFSCILSLSICVLLPFNTHFDNYKIHADELNDNMSKDTFIKLAVGIASANLITFSCSNSNSIYSYLSSKFDEYATSIGYTTSALLNFTYNATLNGVISVVANKVVIAQSCYNRAIDFLNWLGGYDNSSNFINGNTVHISNFTYFRNVGTDSQFTNPVWNYFITNDNYAVNTNGELIDCICTFEYCLYSIDLSNYNIGDVIHFVVDKNSYLNSNNYIDFVYTGINYNRSIVAKNISYPSSDIYGNNGHYDIYRTIDRTSGYLNFIVRLKFLATSPYTTYSLPFTSSLTSSNAVDDDVVITDPLNRTQAELNDKIFPNTDSESMTLDIPNSITVANETDLVNAISQVAIGDLAFALDLDIATDVPIPTYFTNLPTIISMPTCQTLSACLVQGVQTASSHITSFYNTHSELKNYINLSLVISVALMLLGVYR